MKLKLLKQDQPKIFKMPRHPNQNIWSVCGAWWSMTLFHDETSHEGEGEKTNKLDRGNSILYIIFICNGLTIGRTVYVASATGQNST